MIYSPEIVQEICSKIELGTMNKDAAMIVGISEETFYAWQRPFESDGVTPNPEYHPEFSVLVKKAQALRKQNLIGTILNASLKNWQAAAWYLERVHPDEFALKQQVQHSGAVAVLTYEQALKLLEEKKRENVTTTALQLTDGT